MISLSVGDGALEWACLVLQKAKVCRCRHASDMQEQQAKKGYKAIIQKPRNHEIAAFPLNISFISVVDLVFDLLVHNVSATN